MRMRPRKLRKFLPCLVDGLVLIAARVVIVGVNVVVLVPGRVIGSLGTADALNATK